jgi:K+-transporting ATPase ATPase C chain
MKNQIRPAVTMLLILTVLTGLAYPLAVTGLAQLLFPHQANGSLILRDGKVIGSKLIGQYFDKPEYFWGRPSATSPFPYNAAASGGSNLGPTNPALIEAVKARVAHYEPRVQATIRLFPSILSRPPEAGWIPTSARLRPCTK